MGWFRSWEAWCVPTRYSLILHIISLSILENRTISWDTEAIAGIYETGSRTVCWKAPLPRWDLASWRHYCLEGNLSPHMPLWDSSVLGWLPAPGTRGCLLFVAVLCCTACEISVLWPGIEPRPAAVQWRERRSVVSDSLRSHGLFSPWNSPGQNTGAGSLPLLQEIFPSQGLNPGLLHCR